jgi:Flp pilus assembly protein TadG
MRAIDGRHFLLKASREAGHVLPLVALSLAVLMGAGGVAVDVGYLEYQQHQQQNATDAAALGAARQLATANCVASGGTTSAADNDAANNGFTNGVNNVAITVTNPPPSPGPYGSNACAVEVQISEKYAATFFTRTFGFAKGMGESTQAIAQASANNNDCIYLLNPATVSIFNGDTWNSPNCSVLINDTATFNGDPTFAAPYIGYAGAAPIENGTTFTQATPAPMLPVEDPCPEITACNYVANNPISLGTCTSQIYTGGSVNVPSGCYDSLIINGCTNVVFSGIYVFNGQVIVNGSNVSGDGAMFYVTASAPGPVFNGSTLSFSAPAAGNYAGLLYYQSPSNANSPTFNGISSNSLAGLIYAPGALDAIFNGTNGGYLVIVAGGATFNGSTAYDLASPPPNGSLVKEAVLGE